MNEYIKQEYIKLSENQPEDRRVNATHLKIELYYSLGGYNYFTARKEARGYYISVTPVERSDRRTGVIMESYTGFTGRKHCIKEVTRKSAKAEREALEEFDFLQVRTC